MSNTEAVFEFLKVDQEARSRAFDVARYMPFIIPEWSNDRVPNPPTQEVFDFPFKPEAFELPWLLFTCCRAAPVMKEKHDNF